MKPSLRAALLNLTLSLALGLAVCTGAHAGLTQIAQVPLLNITGTGTVKPNLMLLFDNSGSMDQDYTPDYITDNLCRTRATLASGVTGCTVGHPPFMSADFNKQYYSPSIRYAAPIKTDGTYYPDMTAANTVAWTAVTGDGFGAHKTDMFGNTITTTNLPSGFPDLKWCDPANPGTCKTNTATYTYPDNTYVSAAAITANPYYYSIAVGEFCSDNTLTSCQATSAGAAAPAGYPVPVKVRWCDSILLSNCQGKRVGLFIYPRYSTPVGAFASYGTIAINASASAASMNISSVTIPDPGTARTLSSAAIVASTGTNTAAKQQTVASALAASIIAKTGLANQYWACVRTPLGAPTVAPCSVWGITLAADNIVAVIPVLCGSSKSLTACTAVTDSSRAGWGITVTAPSVTVTAAVAYVAPTALLTVAGTSANSTPTPSLASVSYNGVVLASLISIGKNASAASAAAAIVGKVGTAGSIKAYVGGNAITPTCAAKTNVSVCLVDSGATVNGRSAAAGVLTNPGSMTFTPVASAGYVAAAAAVTDSIPSVSAALTGGSMAPSTYVRTDILATRATYPRGSDRSDCASVAGLCSYAEEMTNFANWYAYYKTRLQMMKTSVGIAFAPLSANYRVGYARLSVLGVGGAVDLKPADFTGAARASWYTTLYNTTTSGSTPTRAAMDNVGRMFANLAPYNYAAGAEVVQYPCQQNFMILTTDGYWNGASTPNVSNNDNTENAARFCTAARGCVDTRGQTQPSISDVSLYWYNGGSGSGTVSLRPTLEPDMSKPGSVPAAGGENTHLHMNTYTLGLGVDGIMNYEPNYDVGAIVGGDFYNLVSGTSTGCQWNGGGAYVWPDPDVTNTGNTVQARVDDLWHAAINGHGKYFSASQPKEVVDGLSAAIANMSVRVGAAAAAATSTPNISQQDNDIFSDTFTTVKWFGELSDKKVDIVTGVVGTTASWISSDRLGLAVAAASDTRSIYMLDTSVAKGLKNFKYSAMTVTERAWFDNKGSSLAQFLLLSSADRITANSGANLVDWLRGQQQYADDNIFRSYSVTDHTPAGAAGPIPIVLGDIASSKPAYLRDPRKSYTLAGYAAYKTANATRQASVFTAANDGMLHAFNALTGDEMWAYAPRITMKKLYLQAATTYATNHQFTTDGSPEVADVQIGGVWKSVLVAGLNGGGRGYYALDVTNPATPVALWEFCADATCSNSDGDIGLTFGNPQFGMWSGKWVVFLTAGYNNVPGTDGVASGNGQGILYIVDISNGAVLKKISTGSGDTGTPSGLAKITSISADPFADPVTTYIYGGDVKGQMWRFDLTDTAGGTVAVLKMGDAGVLQPITTRPDVTTCAVTSVSGGVSSTSVQRVVLFGSGRLLDVPDTANTDLQSLYMLKDSGATIAVRGASMVQQTLSLLGTSVNTNTYAISNNSVDLGLKNGWYFDWKLNPGERMNLDPKIVGGGVNVVTNLPSSSSACSVGGTSNVYQVNACSGSYIASDTVAGSTLSNTSAAVGFIIIQLPGGARKMITTTALGTTITSGVKTPNSIGARKSGWRRVTN